MGNDRDYGDNLSTRLTFFLVGAGVGAVLALLFAPKSGEELRNDIADATRKGIDKSREAAQQVGARATEYYDATRARAGEYYESARETAGEYVEATRERATELYDTATTKASEVAPRSKRARKPTWKRNARPSFPAALRPLRLTRLKRRCKPRRTWCFGLCPLSPFYSGSMLAATDKSKVQSTKSKVRIFT